MKTLKIIRGCIFGMDLLKSFIPCNFLVLTIIALNLFLHPTKGLTDSFEQNCHQSLGIIKKIQQAKDLFDAGLYQESIPLFENILKVIHEKDSPLKLEKQQRDQMEADIRSHLVQALFHLKNYQTALTWLENQKNQSDYLMLLGMAYSNNGEYEQAITTLQKYLNSSPINDKRLHDDVLFELAQACYLSGDLTQAHRYFEKLLAAYPPRLQILSRFYLSRIAIKQNTLDLALEYLHQSKPLLIDHSPLKYEAHFIEGEISYLKKDYENALNSFKLAIPANGLKHEKWLADSLHYLGHSYLKLAKLSTSREQQEDYLQHAYDTFLKHLEIKSHDRAWLGLSEYYITLGYLFKDEKALEKAREILSDASKYQLPSSQKQISLLKAQAYITYQERDAHFRQLINASLSDLGFYGEACYLKALNDFEEANHLMVQQKISDAEIIYERTAASLDKAIKTLRVEQPKQAAQAIVLQAKAYAAQKNERDRRKALTALDLFWNDEKTPLHLLNDPLEGAILYSHIANDLSEKELTLALERLNESIKKFPNSPSQANALFALGTFYYRKNDYIHAENCFTEMANKWPKAPLAAEALYRAAQSAEKQYKSNTILQEYKQKILNLYPNSTIAPEAYFTYYTYQEYLQGDRQAIKHLNAFPELYPKSPFVLNAYFLIGLDNKRDRRSPEGKWLRKKNLTYAIDCFQSVQNSFEDLIANHKISQAQLDHYVLVLHRAQLEKGIVNFIIAKESEEAKKQIYLEFAIDTFKDLFSKLHQSDAPYEKWIQDHQPFWHLLEENSYWLIQAQLLAGKTIDAENVLKEMLDKYKSSKITKGFFLSRMWTIQASIFMQQDNYSSALDCLQQAEDAAKGKVLNSDQRLDLLIQQSLCYQKLQQMDKAILLLSKVVNDDTVSNLRIKAMYLRAEIYELQERFELARKQLEATSKKGGEWALKAKEKLEKEYGYR